MSKKHLFTTLLLLLSFSAFSQAPTNETMEKIIAGEMSAAQSLRHFRGDVSATDYNIIYARCYWDIDPSVKFISGHVQTFFLPLKAGMNAISLDLANDLTVDSVLFKNAAVTFSHAGNQLTISLPETLNKNAQYDVNVYYQGVPNPSGFGSFVQMKHGPDSIPALWTLSEPYGASDWWSCKNSLTDKIDSIDIFVTTPSRYRCASNGLLVSETISGSNSVYHWKHRYPIAAYLVAINVSEFVVYSDYALIRNDTLQILNYVWREDSANARANTPALIPALAIFDSLFGKYPFSKEKYGHAQFRWGGGMEHQTMSFVSNFGFELLAHELAHQWFGDKVTHGIWEDIFLNEGFAVYCTDLCYEYLFDGFWWPIWKKNQVGFITSQPSGSIWVDDTTSLLRIFDGRTTYAKGGYFLHQLRFQIGDKAFFNGVKKYINDTALAYKFSKIANLKKHLEESSGKDLTYYFDQWYYGQGYPSYRVEWTQNDKGKVYIILGQTQSDKSVSFFNLLVPVTLKNSTNDTTILLDNTFSGEGFIFSLPFQVDSIFIDPELRIISANNSVEKVPAIDAEDNIILYPNPSTDYFIIAFSRFLNPVESVEVYDMLGRKVFASTVTLAPYQTSIQYNFPSLMAGNYFIKIFTEEKILVKKWNKAK